MPDEAHAPLEEAPGQLLSSSSSAITFPPAPTEEDSNRSEPSGSIPETTTLAPTGDTGPDSASDRGTIGSSSSNSSSRIIATTTTWNDRSIGLVSFPPGSQENAHAIPSRVLPSATQPPQQQWSRSEMSLWCSDCCRQIFLVLAYPGMVVVSIIGLIMVLLFCVLPTMLFMGLVICSYYCVHSDPLPLSVLLRDLFAAENPHNTTSFRHGDSSNMHRDPNSEKARADRALYRTKLIVRRLLAVETADSSPGTTQTRNGGDDNGRIKIIDHRSIRHAAKPTTNDKNTDDEPCKRLFEKIHLRTLNVPIEIWTDHQSLRFSAPLEVPTEDNSDNYENGDGKEKARLAKESRAVPGGDADGHIDNENNIDNADAPGFVPYYRRPFEIELSSGNFREPSPHGRGTDSHRLEHDRTSSDLNVAARSIPLADAVTDSQFESTHCTTNNIDNDDESTDAIPKRRESSDASITSPQTDFYGIEDDARDPGTTCDICILEFEVGDEIAWSPNLHCSHAFHKDCILDWLVRKPTCPSCRQDYVNSATYENV